MAITSIKEIAQLANVSASTVSRVLNGKTYVNEKTREKVLKVINDNNFKPNIVAQSLKNGQVNTICLMVTSISNPIFPLIARGVEDVARDNGYTVVLCNIDEKSDVEKAYIENMKNRYIAGFVIASATEDEEHIYKLASENYPTVLVNRYHKEDLNKLNIIGIDNNNAGYDATKYLIDLNHKRIAIAVGDEKLYFYQERLNGYLRALKDNGIEVDENLIMHSTTDDFSQQVVNLMQLEDKPTAIFATSDPKAISIMHNLRELGIKIPEDVSIIGLDNVDMSRIIYPTLTTISQPLYQFGREAAKSVIQQIEYKKTHGGNLPASKTLILEHELIVRDSTIRRCE